MGVILRELLASGALVGLVRAAHAGLGGRAGQPGAGGDGDARRLGDAHGEDARSLTTGGYSLRDAMSGSTRVARRAGR